jgi:hypothetical protein
LKHTTNRSLQQALIEEVLKKFPNKQAAKEELSEVLAIGKEPCSRRIQNRTMLSPDEISKICRHFGISIDPLIQKASDNVIFNYNTFIEPVKDFESYINQLLRNLKIALQLEGAMIYYATQEITPFQYFFFPELTAFKLYTYGLTVWELKNLEHQKCSMDLISPDVMDKAKECARLYTLLPSTDLWSWGILNHSLNQIEYLSETKRFDPPELALKVCDQLLELLDRHREMASIGKKYFKSASTAASYGDFFLHYNELVNTNNTILLKSPSLKLLFTTFGNPNFLSTSDSRTCKYFEHWFENTISRSIAISIHSEKNRNYFFNRLARQVNQLKKKIRLSLNQ